MTKKCMSCKNTTYKKKNRTPKDAVCEFEVLGFLKLAYMYKNNVHARDK